MDPQVFAALMAQAQQNPALMAQLMAMANQPAKGSLLSHPAFSAQYQAWSAPPPIVHTRRDPGERIITGSLADTTVNTGFRQGGSSPDAAKIEAAYIGFGTRLNNRLQLGMRVWDLIATPAYTNDLLNRELWLNSIGTMRMWEGNKVLNQLSAESLPIVTRPHENSLQIPKGDILNDRYGMYGSKIDMLGDSFNWALDDLVITMLCAGVAGTALGTTYDGQNLIDTDHTTLSVGGTNQSNKVTGAFSATTYQSAVNQFLGFKNEFGVPVNLGRPNWILLHGPANRVAVRTVLQQQIGAGLVQNLDAGTAQPLCTPWISARTTKVLGTSVTLTGLEWFLIPTNSTAVIVQIKRNPEFLEVTQGELAFMSGKFLYGIEAEFGAAYGLWQEIVGGPGA
jgi:phage major head subunit gpT-like protein